MATHYIVRVLFIDLGKNTVWTV